MKNILRRIKNFFFPASRSIRALAVPYTVLGVMTVVLLTGGAYAWDYTNSPGFCGTSCHTMPPEFSAYQVSPHARVDCVDCHIGKGFIATRVSRKAGDLRHVFATVFRSYEFPIRAKELRPARETCELCHSPDKFSDDSLREITTFQNDRNNTPQSIFLTLKTGGGSKRQGLGRGIHWHIENTIEYLAADPEEQEIPYVRVIDEQGKVTEYMDMQAEIDPAGIDPEQLKEMDCITCHNRITHRVAPPEDTVDGLISRGLISKDIPDIRRQSVELYGRLYDTTQMGLISISGLENYYREVYPDYYTENRELIEQAVAALQEAYSASVYPEQKSDWTTHPDNIGHKDSPGCFRCHDGKHLDAEQKAIRLECNLCHSIPVVAGPDDFVASLEIHRGPEPETHLNENWISLHNQVIDSSCSSCHTTEDPGGTSNTSFCSNSACHGSAWEYAGFDAPGLRQVLLAQLPPTPTPAPAGEVSLTYQAAIGPILEQRCGSCHGDSGLQGLSLTSYAGLMKGSDGGPVVVPGEAEASRIVQVQSAEQPHFAQLQPEELNLLVEWIQAGAPEE